MNSRKKSYNVTDQVIKLTQDYEPELLYSYPQIDRILHPGNRDPIRSEVIDDIQNFLDPRAQYEQVISFLTNENELVPTTFEEALPNWLKFKFSKDKDLIPKNGAPSSNLLNELALEINLETLYKEDRPNAELFLKNPIVWLYSLRLRIYQVVRTRARIYFKALIPTQANNFFEVNENNIDSCITLIGTLKKAKTVQSMAVISSTYQCKLCMSKTIVDRAWYQKIKNVRCICAGSSSSGQNLIELESKRLVESWRSVSLQEDLYETINCDTKTPGLVLLRLKDPTTYSDFKPGEKVQVIGCIRLDATEKSESTLYIDVYAIIKLDQLNNLNQDLTPETIEQLHKLSKNKDLWAHLRKTCFPDVCGLDHVKDSILLQQFSAPAITPGSYKPKNLDSTGASVRETINLLVVGDSGTGKSKLLTTSHKVFGGIFTTGIGATTAGLTASVYKDKDNEWNVEAGILVMANNRVLYLDELDKIPSNSVINGMLECMQQQTVSIAKAGVNANYPAKTRIFAVANPKFKSQFDHKTTPIDQIELPKTLLSRFDIISLVFEEDVRSLDDFLPETAFSKAGINAKNLELIKQYIQYARHVPEVKFSPQIKERVTKMYLAARNKLNVGSETRIMGVRQLESIIRMCKAKARSRLDDTVSEQDFLFVKQMFLKNLQDLYGPLFTQDPTLNIELLADLRVSKKEEKVISLIKQVLEIEQLSLTDCLLAVVQKDHTCTKNVFLKALACLENAGLVYKPDGTKYKLTKS